MCTILVVEDEQPTRDLAKMLLETYGYQVRTARDGLEALSILSEEIDLVLTDNMMPRLDGIGLCRALRDRFDHAGMPIILMSAGKEPVDHRGLYDVFVQKPFSVEELVDHAERLLKRRA